MKFEINAGELVRALSATHDVAINCVTTGADSEFMVTINSEKDKIVALAFGGGASAISEISDNHFGGLSYKCIDTGEVTFNTKAMKESLLIFGEADVNVELESNQLIVSLHDDSDFSQSIPIYDNPISPPPIAVNFSKEISINREVLLDGIKKVLYAVGFEEQQGQYLCLVLQTSKNNVRFIAGTGGEFAITDISGANIVGGDKSEIIFPRWNLTNITSILAESNAKNVRIKYAKKDDTNKTVEQIVLQFSGTDLCIFRIESNIKAPKVDSVLNFDYPNIISTSIEEWKRSAAGISASETGDKESDKIANTKVVFNTKKKCFNIETIGLYKSKSKVNVNMSGSIIADSAPWFKCNSTHIKNMSSRSGFKSGDVVINFEDQELINGVNDDSQRIKPVLVTYPEYQNSARDTTESFKLFFIVSTL